MYKSIKLQINVLNGISENRVKHEIYLYGDLEGLDMKGKVYRKYMHAQEYCNKYNMNKYKLWK